MTFYVGQRVVCVSAKGNGAFMKPGVYFCGNLDGLEEGAIYIISGVVEAPTTISDVGIHLREIKRPYGAPYDIARFRPLTEAGMSILRAIAADPKPLVEQEPEYEGIPFLD